MTHQEEWLKEACIEFLERTDWFIVRASEDGMFKVRIEFLPFGEDCNEEFKVIFVIDRKTVQDWAWKRWRWNEPIPPTIRQFL